MGVVSSRVSKKNLARPSSITPNDIALGELGESGGGVLGSKKFWIVDGDIARICASAVGIVCTAAINIIRNEADTRRR